MPRVSRPSRIAPHLIACCWLTAGTAWAQQPPDPRTADCVINPSMTLKIGSPVSTTLASVEVDRGDHVAKEQPLARLESSVETADLALAEARAHNMAEVDRARSKAELAGADLARGESLLRNGNIPPQKVDELRSNYRVAQQDQVTAELNRSLAELELQRSRALVLQKVIRSPVAGIVTQRLLGPGEFAHQDNQILVIAVISPLHVEAYPPVRLWGRVRPGDVAQVTMADPVGVTAEATVTVVDQVFDAASGTFGVRLELPNRDGKLPAGQRCRVTFDLSAAAKP